MPLHKCVCWAGCDEGERVNALLNATAGDRRQTGAFNKSTQHGRSTLNVLAKILGEPLRSLMFVAALLVLNCVARADTLASFTQTGTNIQTPNYLGEQFTTSGSGTYSNVAFTFLSNSGSDYAIGTGFLLSSQYTGSPSSLSSSTAGYLGSASAANGLYSFGTGVTVQAGSTYYFYENVLAPGGSVPGSFDSSAGPTYNYAVSGGNFTAQYGATADFVFTGNAVTNNSVTPEPSSIALFGTGVLGIAGVIRRRVA